jgi:hypothetical protein
MNLKKYEYKPWFEEGCSELLDQRKQAKLQLLQDLSEINGDNPKNVKCEANRQFRKRKTNEFKRGFQPRNILVKDENGDFLAYTQNVLNRLKNYFS